MLVSCLMPTFNRYPNKAALVEEAVNSFLLQDYDERELLICNDTPGQKLEIIHPKIKVYNLPNRFDTLGNKLHWMLQQADGDFICRWDDDDISLPGRIGYSVGKLLETAKVHPELPNISIDGQTYAMEWRPENHWYSPNDTQDWFHQSKHPGNTHIAAIWYRGILGGAVYPGQECPSGLEDQTFTSQLRNRGYPYLGELTPMEDIMYIYRWGVSPVHLSGKGGGERMQQTYEEIGGKKIACETFTITPRWYRNYAKIAADSRLKN